MRQLTGRQREIIEAALDIIADQGIQRMTIKNLARAVGVSEPALYRHFKSKFNILLSILVQYRLDLVELFEKGAHSPRSPMDAVSSLYREMFQGFVRRPSLSLVIFSEDLFRYDRRLSQEVSATIEMTHDRVYGMLREGARRGEVRSDIPAKQLAWMVMGTMRLLVARWRISGYSLDLVREGQQLLAFMRAMLAS